jgi:hypothetical protein
VVLVALTAPLIAPYNPVSQIAKPLLPPGRRLSAPTSSGATS